MNMRMLWALLLVCAIIAIWWYRRAHYDTVEVEARTWNVIGKYENRADAAALLGRVNARMINFLRKLKAKYHVDEPGGPTPVAGSPFAMVDYLLDNYNPDVFYENDATDGETSYTINKGAAMYICLREPLDKSKLVDESDLFFVLLHESAHIANYQGWGHGEDFWSVFKFMLIEAEIAGEYTPVDYSKHPIKYCGLDVTYNPYFDKSLP